MFEEGIKKNQFADAIVFEQIKTQRSDNVPVIILSQDRDFKLASSKEKNIIYMESWGNLLNYLEIEDEAPEMQGFLESQKDIIVDIFVKHMNRTVQQFELRLQTYGLQRNNENNEVDTNAYGTTIADYIRSVNAQQGPSMRSGKTMYVSGIVTIKAELPSDYALRFTPLWRSYSAHNFIIPSSAIETIFKLEITADMFDCGNHHFSGAIRIMGPYGYSIDRMNWDANRS